MNIDGKNLNAFVLYWSVNIYEKKDIWLVRMVNKKYSF